MPIIVSAFKPLPSLTFFGDSSSRNRDHMVAGGFAVRGTRIAEIESYIEELRSDAGISEFHWSDYRGGDRREAYKALIRYAFELVRKRHAALHIIIARFKGYRHKRQEGENEATSVNRMYYQLCLHRVARFYGKSCTIRVRLDSGDDCKSICEIRKPLCAAAYQTYATRPNCIRQIEPVCSVKAPIVQMADVILGAIASRRNNVTYSKPAKAELAAYVQEQACHSDWARNSPKSARFLTVWNHQSGS